MKKIVIPITVLGVLLGAYWWWQRRSILKRAEPVTKSQPTTRNEIEETANETYQEEAQANLLANREDFKDWTIAVKCNVNH